MPAGSAAYPLSTSNEKLTTGAVWRSARWLRLGGGRGLALASYALYFGTAAMLILGMIATYKPQHRL